MRKIKEMLRLKALGLTNRQIAGSIKASHSTVGEYLRLAQAAGISWPVPEDIDEAQLKAKLFPQEKPPAKRAAPDCAYIHSELKRKSVTLKLLWQEYREANPDGLGYTQFTVHYRRFRGTLSPTLRQSYKAGEKAFVDYAGQTVPITCPKTGHISEAQIFVAVLAASNYTYAEATATQELSCWIGSHVKAYNYFGGVPQVTVPDNLKTGVTKACYYEPDLNPTYQDMAAHYGTVVIPARVRRPRDKAKVESAVLVVERWILARLRNRTFFSLAQLNEAIATLVKRLNNEPFAKLEGTRHSLFETLEKPALLPLPTRAYEFATWKKAKVNIDYHLEVKGHYYSVPYRLIGRRLDVRLTGSTVEILAEGRRITSHSRSYKKGGHTTKEEHRPKAHRKYLDCSPSRMVAWAGQIGPATGDLAEAIIRSRKHPEHGYRSCQGLVRLGKLYPQERLEAASRLALGAGAFSYKSVKSILDKGLDKLPEAEDETRLPLGPHGNIRGSGYYH
jgi:transposase